MHQTAQKVFNRIDHIKGLVRQMEQLGREALPSPYGRHNSRGTDLYSPFTYEIDVAEEGCNKVFDFWVSKEKNHNGSYYLGVWRNHKNIYGGGGKQASREEVLEGSETEKLLYEDGELSFYWVRNGLDSNFPSETFWGLKFNKPTIQVRKGGEVLFETEENTYELSCQHELSDWMVSYDKSEEYVPKEFRGLTEEEIELKERLIELRGF